MPLVYQLDTWRAVLKVHVGLVLYNRIFPKTRYPCGHSVKHQVYVFQLHICELIIWPLDGSVDHVVIFCTDPERRLHS